MKASAVYRKAAELVDNGSEYYIGRQMLGDEFYENSAKWIDGGTEIIIDDHEFYDKEIRVMWMLLMSEIAKDEERK